MGSLNKPSGLYIAIQLCFAAIAYAVYGSMLLWGTSDAWRIPLTCITVGSVGMGWLSRALFEDIKSWMDSR